jgi:hypothetical protein
MFSVQKKASDSTTVSCSGVLPVLLAGLKPLPCIPGRATSRAPAADPGTFSHEPIGWLGEGRGSMKLWPLFWLYECGGSVSGLVPRLSSQ